MDLDKSNADECYETAVQIFDHCGAVNSGTLRVDYLMEKFSPLVKTNKAEFNYLRSVLDPDKSNPEISVVELARGLAKYSASQKRGDLDESFIFKCGQVPQDSDSGISNDGFQLLEDLQCELREKSHLASQLRSQLDFTDRQHEEALASLTAERDSLRVHLNVLREENASLAAARSDCEDACERLCHSERALEEATRELEALKRKAKAQAELIPTLEGDKLTLQELLAKSKEECHRINEMYASRQSNLLEQNEALRSQSAELATRLHDQDELLQQLIREKVILEMELKDVLNKSAVSAARLDRSVDVSYTEEQMLTALDSLTADSRFVPENHLLDEESFMNALKDDPGRSTNMSIFDELRHSFGNMSRFNMSHDKPSCIDQTDTATQTDEITPFADNNNDEIPCGDCQIACSECAKLRDYTAKLESDVKRLQSAKLEIFAELTKYEANLQLLQDSATESSCLNEKLQNVVNALETKLLVVQEACAAQRLKIESLVCDTSCAGCQTDSDVASVATQCDVPCVDCEKRAAPAPLDKSWRRFMWEPLKSAFSILAGVCCLAALIILYNVSNYHYASRRCIREAPAVPWRWLSVHDLLDFVFRIEYVGEVPM